MPPANRPWEVPLDLETSARVATPERAKELLPTTDLDIQRSFGGGEPGPPQLGPRRNGAPGPIRTADHRIQSPYTVMKIIEKSGNLPQTTIRKLT
jgi:hypothetical protein